MSNKIISDPAENDSEATSDFREHVTTIVLSGLDLVYIAEAVKTRLDRDRDSHDFDGIDQGEEVLQNLAAALADLKQEATA